MGKRCFFGFGGGFYQLEGYRRGQIRTIHPQRRAKRLGNRYEGLTSFVTGILGPRGIEHVPFLGTLFIYVLFNNWLGLIPLMKSPTSAWSTTIALALVTITYVHTIGIREQGFFNYLKHMAGNPQGAVGLALIPLMLIINIAVEYLAVPLSLSLGFSRTSPQKTVFSTNSPN